MSVPAIHTARLTLRAFVRDDEQDVFDACSNPILGKNAGWPPHQCIEDSLDYIESIVPMGKVWAVTEQDNPRVIGSVGLLPDPRTPEDKSIMLLGYWMAEDQWNKGYATEAARAVVDWGFEEEGLSKITTSHFPFNNASRRVIEKCGFVPTELGLWPADDSNEPDEEVQWYEKVSLYNRFVELQDTGYADFQAKLTPTLPRDAFLGVRVPLLRKIAKEFAKTPESSIFMKQLPHRYYEENMLHSFLLAGMKDYDSVIAGLESYLPYVDNWAVCDSLSPKVFKKHLDDLIARVPAWLASPEPFTCRFGLVTLMDFFLKDAFDPSFLEMPLQIHSEEYYVNMALAWFYATALTYQWDATIPIIENRRLDEWVHRKTIQKARESYRITTEQKEYLASISAPTRSRASRT